VGSHRARRRSRARARHRAHAGLSRRVRSASRARARVRRPAPGVVVGLRVAAAGCRTAGVPAAAGGMNRTSHAYRETDDGRELHYELVWSWRPTIPATYWEPADGGLFVLEW